MGTDAGIKHDEGKIRYDLVPPHALEGLAKVLTFGANKYTPNGWKTVEKERYVAALMRHFEAYRKGELLDQESGLPHMYHVLCCATFISEMDRPEEVLFKIMSEKLPEKVRNVNSPKVELASSEEEQPIIFNNSVNE